MKMPISLLSAGLLAAAAPLQAFSVRTSPDLYLGFGQTGTIDLIVEGLGLGGSYLGSYQVVMSYDPAVATAFSATPGSALGGPVDSIYLPNLFPGAIDVTEISLLGSGQLSGLQQPTETLVQFDFLALDYGTTLLSFDLVELGDALGFSVAGDVVYEASITVPESGSVGWGLAALTLGFVAFRRTGAARAH